MEKFLAKDERTVFKLDIKIRSKNNPRIAKTNSSLHEIDSESNFPYKHFLNIDNKSYDCKYVAVVYTTQIKTFIIAFIPSPNVNRFQ